MCASYRLRPPLRSQDLVRRPRLTEVVQSTVPGAACVVSGPPGYGITTLLREAVAGAETFWLALDSNVPDDRARALLGEALAVSPGVDAVLDRLAQAGPCWLVVDGVNRSSATGWRRAARAAVRAARGRNRS